MTINLKTEDFIPDNMKEKKFHLNWMNLEMKLIRTMFPK